MTDRVPFDDDRPEQRKIVIALLEACVAGLEAGTIERVDRWRIHLDPALCWDPVSDWLCLRARQAGRSVLWFKVDRPGWLSDYYRENPRGR